MTHPSPEAVAKAMDYAVVVARDMKRRAARGTHPDMPSETCIDTLAAHVTALTTQLEAERAKWADAALQHANNILAKLDTIADLHARLSAETARADKAEAEAKALREAVKSADALLGRILKHGEIAVLDVGSPFSTYGGKKPPSKEMWAVPRHMHAEIEELRATLAQPAADGGGFKPSAECIAEIEQIHRGQAEAAKAYLANPGAYLVGKDGGQP